MRAQKTKRKIERHPERSVSGVELLDGLVHPKARAVRLAGIYNDFSVTFALEEYILADKKDMGKAQQIPSSPMDPRFWIGSLCSLTKTSTPFHVAQDDTQKEESIYG